MMKKYIPIRYSFLLVVLATAFPLQAELAPHRIQVTLGLSPRPPDGAPRPQDVLFDQRAALKTKLVNLSEPAKDIRIQWAFLYDSITVGGKRKRESFSNVIPLEMKKGEEKTLESPFAPIDSSSE